jgi:hypothetical protein
MNSIFTPDMDLLESQLCILVEEIEKVRSQDDDV